MKRYRFKTKDEFIRDGLWDYDNDCPNHWNAEGEMNCFLGVEITDRKSIFQCENGVGFYTGDWSFRSSDYVELEDYSGRQVRALVDNPDSIHYIKKGDIVILADRSFKSYTIFNGDVKYFTHYPLDLTKWELVDGPEQQKYYDDLSQHIGRYIKALVDYPSLGMVREGEYGLITSYWSADFPSQKNYGCTHALSKEQLNKLYELMPEGFVPPKSDMYELIEEAKRRYPIGSRVSNKNLNYDCDFNIDTHDFSEDLDDSGIVVKTKEGYFTVYSKYSDKWADIIYEPKTSPKQFERGKWYTNPLYPDKHAYFRISNIGTYGDSHHIHFDAVADRNWSIRYTDDYSQANSDFEAKMELVDHMDLIQREAMSRFPIGSLVIPIGSDDQPTRIKSGDILYEIHAESIFANLGCGCLFLDNKWAERVDKYSTSPIESHSGLTSFEFKDDGTVTVKQTTSDSYDDELARYVKSTHSQHIEDLDKQMAKFLSQHPTCESSKSEQIDPIYSTTIKLKSKKSSKTLKL